MCFHILSWSFIFHIYHPEPTNSVERPTSWTTVLSAGFPFNKSSRTTASIKALLAPCPKVPPVECAASPRSKARPAWRQIQWKTLELAQKTYKNTSHLNEKHWKTHLFFQKKQSKHPTSNHFVDAKWPSHDTYWPWPWWLYCCVALWVAGRSPVLDDRSWGSPRQFVGQWLHLSSPNRPEDLGDQWHKQRAIYIYKYIINKEQRCLIFFEHGYNGT